MRSKFYLLFLTLTMLSLASCSGGGSSNSGGGTPNKTNIKVDPEVVEQTETIECSEGFGDASRCDARDDL